MISVYQIKLVILKSIITKIDNNVSDLKEIIQIDGNNATIDSNINEILHYLCHYIDEFGTKRRNISPQSAAVYHTCGCSSNVVQQIDTSSNPSFVSKATVHTTRAVKYANYKIVDKRVTKVKDNKTSVFEILKICNNFT